MQVFLLRSIMVFYFSAAAKHYLIIYLFFAIKPGHFGFGNKSKVRLSCDSSGFLEMYLLRCFMTMVT